MKRVFVTGIGVVSPVGNHLADTWSAIVAGRSGIAPLESLDTTDLPVTIGGEVRGLDFSVVNLNERVTARKMDRSSVFAVAAAKEAIADAGLEASSTWRERTAVVIGSGLAGLQTLQDQTENLLNKGPRTVSPFTIPLLMPNAAVANVSLAFELQGTVYNVASACSSSGHALIDAYELIQRDEAELVVTGGAEACMTRLSISAFANMKALTKKYNQDPTHASRPFDVQRDGFVMAEGAAILILESEAHAIQRQAKRYAELIGYGATADAHHLVQPDVTGRQGARAVQRALQMAKLVPAEIAEQTYVNAHGTSTHYNDLMETNLLKTVFGDSATKLQISSTKSCTGHLIGAAAALESLVCCQALKEGILPPTINYEHPDPECNLDYIPNQARTAQMEFALNQTFGFGGHNVALLFRRI